MSKAHLRSILENSVDTVYCFNMQTGHFEYVSPSVKVMTGISSEEFLSMDIEQLVSRIHPDYRSVVSDAQKLSEKTGNAIADYLFLAKDGQYRWISDHMRIVKDDEGKSLYRFGNSRDITELKNTEKALQESETKYRTIVETASEGIWQVDGNLKTVYANEKMAKMLGYSDSEIIGRYVFDFLDEGGKRFAKKWHERRVMGIEGSFEYKFVRKDGSYIITATNVSSLKDDKGNFIGSIGLITDITERKKMEESFRATQHKLNLALENANIGIWEWDLTTGKVIWDERTELMFGLKPGSFGKTQKAFEDLVYEEDLPRIRNAFQNALEKNLPYEVVFRKKADSNYITTKAMVTRSKSGKPLIMTGVSFDVTSMKKGTEKALIKLNEELSRSNQELQQFANIASHDLQEPLRMVSSFTQLLQQRYKDKLDKDANEYINFAIEGSRRMYEMINSLLAYSRVQTRGKEFDIVNMNDVIEKVSGNLSITIREKKAVLNHDDLPIVFADENQMIQLMQNLVDNGIKFSKDYPKIIVSSRSEDNYNIISVKDEGIGIEPQYFDRIFKIFQRLHCSGSYKGTGIGLAICKRIIERHEGKIWLDSQPGKGSTFYFSIPKKRL